MSVPLLDLKAQYRTIKDEVLASVNEVFESQYFILGPKVQEFEKQVAAYSGTKHAIGVSSGTDALLVSLMAAGIGEGDEVITTPYSFFATAGCISRLGAVPVFSDIDPVTYNINPSAIESKITGKTKAIIPVHLYGQVADMDPILEIARKHSLVVIEDAAQAIGAGYKDKRAGSFGDFGCFSFFPSKNLGGAGEGGMVVTNDDDLANKLKILRVHGGETKYHHSTIGGNFRLDAIQAAVLNVKLKHLESWTEGRRKNADIYRKNFADAGVVASEFPVSMKGKKGVALPVELENCRHIYNQFVIRVDNRDDLRKVLMDKSIGHDVYYPVPFHMQKCFGYLGYKEGDFPESENAANQTVALPVYPELTTEMIKEVVETIAGFVK